MKILLYILVVGYAISDHRAGNEVLQFVLALLAEGFELAVDAYREVLSYISERALFLRIYLTYVAIAIQYRWVEQTQEYGFKLSLLARQYKASVITTLAVIRHIGDHCHRPLSKTL